MHVGVAAKGVVAMRIRVDGRAAHGATPWLGENAILRALDVFRAIQSLPFASRSSELFDRPSINLGRILGGDALNKVPDTCYIDVDVRYLPEQDPDAILGEVAGIPGATIVSTFKRPPAMVDPESPFVRALCAATASHTDGEVTSVGRDGASDAVSFLRAGVPAVEFGPTRRGPPRPDEWVSVELACELPPGARRVRREPAASTWPPAATGTPDEPGRRARRADGRPRATRAPASTQSPPPATWAGRQRSPSAAEPETRPRPTSADRTRPRSTTRSRPTSIASSPVAAIPTSMRLRRRGRGEDTDEDELDQDVDDEEEVDDEEAPAEEAPDEELDGQPSGETVEAETVTPRRSRAGRGGGARRAPRPRSPRTSRSPSPSRRVARPSTAGPRTTPERSDKPPRASPLWARFLAASLVIVISMAAATSISLLLYLTDIAEGLSDNDKLASLRDQLTEVDGRRPADDPDHRLRQAPRHEGRPGPLRHHDPAPRRSRQARDRAAVDPPRPEGEHPRGRGGEVQRGVLGRRSEEDAQGGPAAHRAEDQPRRQHQLHRLRRRGRRDRLRLHRRRPPLLHPAGLGDRGDRRRGRATSGCAASTRSSTCASAISTTTSCGRRASKISSARPARSCRRRS